MGCISWSSNLSTSSSWYLYSSEIIHEMTMWQSVIIFIQPAKKEEEGTFLGRVSLWISFCTWSILFSFSLHIGLPLFFSEICIAFWGSGAYTWKSHLMLKIYILNKGFIYVWGIFFTNCLVHLNELLSLHCLLFERKKENFIALASFRWECLESYFENQVFGRCNYITLSS